MRDPDVDVAVLGDIADVAPAMFAQNFRLEATYGPTTLPEFGEAALRGVFEGSGVTKVRAFRSSLPAVAWRGVSYKMPRADFERSGSSLAASIDVQLESTFRCLPAQTAESVDVDSRTDLVQVERLYQCLTLGEELSFIHDDTGVKQDVYFIPPSKLPRTVQVTYNGPCNDRPARACLFPIRSFGTDDLVPVTVAGVEFLAPPTSYLEDMYGSDWETPVQFPDYKIALAKHLYPNEVTDKAAYNNLLRELVQNVGDAQWDHQEEFSFETTNGHAALLNHKTVNSIHKLVADVGLRGL